MFHQKYAKPDMITQMQIIIAVHIVILTKGILRNYSQERRMHVYIRYIAGLKRRFFKLCYNIFCVLPIITKKVSFASDSRSKLNGNLLFVFKELQNRQLNLK